MLFEAEGIVGIVLFAFWIYCILDVIATDSALCRNLPKGVWLLLVLMIPDIGGIAWLLLGRPEKAGFKPGDTTYRKPSSFRIQGPDDDPLFQQHYGSTPAARPTPRPEPELKKMEAPLPTSDDDVRSTPLADPADEARRQRLAAREAEVQKAELAAWEAELSRREAQLKKPDGDGGGGLYGGGRW